MRNLGMKAEDVALIVLAGGRSVRFGAEDKLQAMLHGRPLGLHTAFQLAPMAWAYKLAVSSGNLTSPLRKLGFDIVDPLVDGGLGDNIAKGIRTLKKPHAVLVCLADMPFVTQAHVEGLLDAMSSERSIAASEGEGAISPPVLFGKAYFDALQALTGDAGARDVILANKSVLVRVPTPWTTLIDVDTPAMLAEAHNFTVKD
jgi:molybdenum cofactor cytidylyltransferase